MYVCANPVCNYTSLSFGMVACRSARTVRWALIALLCISLFVDLHHFLECLNIRHRKGSCLATCRFGSVQSIKSSRMVGRFVARTHINENQRPNVARSECLRGQSKLGGPTEDHSKEHHPSHQSDRNGKEDLDEDFEIENIDIENEDGEGIGIDIPQEEGWTAEWKVTKQATSKTSKTRGIESLFDDEDIRKRTSLQNMRKGGGSGQNFYTAKRSILEDGKGGKGQYRLDRFIAAQAADMSRPLSRERLKALIRDGKATVNSRPVKKPSATLKDGDIVRLEVPSPQPLRMEAEDLSIEIVFEDEDMLVVCKPAGMLTHPTPKQYNGTLVNAILHKCEGRLSSINGIIRPGIVHRLDRDTEGLLLIAKTDRAHRHLAAQIKEHSARRTYRAIVYGNPRANSGTIDAPLRIDHKQRRIAVDPGGRHAVTHWRVLERFGGCAALVECELETGRQHQIRAHMRHIRHPLIGDPVYGKGFHCPYDLPSIPGQALQAYKLQFDHPVTNERLTVEVPEAGYMLRTLNALRDASARERRE